MNLSEVAVRRPVLTWMIVLALFVFGMTSYQKISVSLFPDVDFPIVTVSVVFNGADPETMEREVSDRIEEGVNTINGIKSIRSESTEGIAQIFIEFELERDINVASQEVRDKVASIRSELPRGIEAPLIDKFDPDSSPILTIVLSGPSSIKQLTAYAKDLIKPKVEGLGGVGSVKLVGGREREVRLWIKSQALQQYGLSAQDVISALQRENIEIPGGRLENADREIVVKTKGKIDRIAKFSDLVIVRRAGNPIRIGDICYVEDGMEDERSLSRLNRVRAVSLLVRRQSGTNLVAVAENVKDALQEIRGKLPQNYDIVLAQDLSIFVRQSLDEAQSELIRGGLLAVFVILVFLLSWRGAFVAALTIPTTIVSTYAFMLVMGFSFNMMSALALSISVGMIIDDAIVVIENTTRHMEMGKTRIEAAIAGMKEIGFAVVVTSLAIGAVFVPVAFMKGLVGRFFFEFGLTVAFAVGVSTFLALTLSPMLCSRLLTLQNKSGFITSLNNKLFQKVEGAYAFLLKYALRARILLMIGVFIVFGWSLSLTKYIGKEFVPAQDESQFNVQIETPLGSSLSVASRNLREIEKRIRQIPEVTNLFTTIGGGQDRRVNNASLLVQLVPINQRNIGQLAVMAEVRDLLRGLSHLKCSVELIPRVSGGGFRSAPLQYNIRGGNLNELEKIAERIMTEMRKVKGIVDVNSTYNASKPEVLIIPDRERVSDLGIDIEKLGRAVKSLIGGQEVSTFTENGQSYDVRLRLMHKERNRVAALLAIPVKGKDQRLVEFRSLVTIKEGTGPVQIDRQNRKRQITIMANLEKTRPLASALEQVKRIEGEIGLAEGVTGTFTGPGDMMKESFESINFTLLMAIVLIYMVLAAQFESWIHPLTIMLSLPLSVGGALGALALTGRTLNIFTMIGMIMLMGLVTKNAILLVDYTILLRSRGMEKTKALLTAGPVRLRPILMTAFSTIAGMLPIAMGLGAGSETRAPMGAAVVGGMLTSTLLTLIVIPVMYSLMDDLGSGVAWLFGMGPSEAATAQAHQINGHEINEAEAEPDQTSTS
jgi:hydrophobic/amphiphilic exporter-1 (mainly G- bacteria), HAE1 family